MTDETRLRRAEITSGAPRGRARAAQTASSVRHSEAFRWEAKESGRVGIRLELRPTPRGPCVGPVESWGQKANREGSVPDPPETQGVYQMGDVQARSWTTGTCAGLQHPSKPAVMVEGSSQETPESAQIC